MADLPREQLAAVARTADDLDAVLDKLFANVAELKAVLGRDRAGGNDKTEERPLE